MSDIGLVDAALMEVLANDAALTALCPGGVYWDIRPPGEPAPTAYIVVSHFDYSAEPGLGGTTLYETILYWVRATVLGSSRTTARLANARIYALLQGTLLDLTAAGYVAMSCTRVDHRPYVEVDPVNKSLWQHHGSQYEVISYPID